MCILSKHPGDCLISCVMRRTLYDRARSSYGEERYTGISEGVFGSTVEEMQAFVVETERVWQALGGVRYGQTEAEPKSLVFRRSVYVAQDVKAGEAPTTDNAHCVRPGMGLPPKFYDLLVGRSVNQELNNATHMDWKYLG
jgi:sialic acid synthase SpsE